MIKSKWDEGISTRTAWTVFQFLIYRFMISKLGFDSMRLEILHTRQSSCVNANRHTAYAVSGGGGGADGRGEGGHPCHSGGGGGYPYPGPGSGIDGTPVLAGGRESTPVLARGKREGREGTWSGVATLPSPPWWTN